MSTVTAELNDLATQAILKPADGGGYHLTVTDGCDVIVVRLGDHGVGQVALALASYKPTEPLPGLLDIDALSADLRSSSVERSRRAHPSYGDNQ